MTEGAKRGRAEEALRASEERFRAQFKGIPVPTYVWRRVGDDFVLADYTDAADAITRGAVARILGTTARALYADAPDILEDFERCFREKCIVSRQTKYRFRTTGEVRDFDVTYGFIPPDSVIVHTQDISERTLAENSLRSCEERHRMILSNLDEIVYMVGIENGNPLESPVQFVSEGVERIAGYCVEEFLQDPGVWLRAVHPEDLSAVVQSTQKILESGKSGIREYRLRHGKTGAYTWIEDHVIPRLDDSGRPAAILGVARDVTERKRAEEKFRSLLESAADAMVIVDRNGEILLVNAQTERLFGYARQELLGQPLEILVPPRVRERHRQQRTGYAADPRTRPMGTGRELCGLRKDGTEFPAEISLSRFETEEGPLVSSAIRDITERKRAEEELQASRERLLALPRRLIEAQEAERRHVARELHDELGQELTALKINLQAAHRPGDDAELASRLDDSMDIVERAIQQVRDMALALRPSLLDDLGLVAALRWLVDHQAQRSGFEARLEAEPARIRVSSEVEIGCYRVAQEALNNVARHAQAHNVRVEVALHKGGLRLLIHDDGVGFDVKSARERASHGASMGLLTMSERARLLGGKLEMKSTPGQGTEIRAVFPTSPAR